MSFWSRNKALIFSFICVGAVGVLVKGCTSNKNQCLYSKKENSEDSDLRKKEIASNSSTENIQHFKIVEREQVWGEIQSKIKDTVVQVIAQLAPFNFVQPYKTPDMMEVGGSAFFISSDGYLITNAHVINQAQSVWIRIPSLGKQIIDAKVVSIAPERDLALLKIDKESFDAVKSVIDIPYLPLGDSDSLNRADKVMALGYPLGQGSLKSTEGVVSGREHLNGQHLIQMSAPINPGSSGGPVINIHGEVVGISEGGVVEAQNIGDIIPISELKVVLPSMYHEDEGKIKLLRKPFLGVVYVNGSQDLCQYLGNPVPGGTYIVETYKGSPLEKAGVEGGDMVYRVDGYDVDYYGDILVPWSEDKVSVTDYISRLHIGQEINMLVYSKGTPKEIKIKFEETELLPVRMVFPGYEELDYENVGGMVIMPLFLNHLPIFASNCPRLTQYTKAQDQSEAALIVTHICPNSQAHRALAISPGSIIEEVNDKKVQTLQEFRDAIKTAIEQKEKFLLMSTTDGVKVAFAIDKFMRDSIVLSQLYRYPVSHFAKECLETFSALSGKANITEAREPFSINEL